jgi:type VII secretion-associated protein (TIGR03931 family)
VAFTVLFAAIAAGFWSESRIEGAAPVPPTALVEGRVAMEIPAGWNVQFVTAGPGSARVQVVSPSDGETALHLTQSRVRDEDLAESAAILRRAFDGQPAGVFVDFHPSDVRAGRPAVTYREVRPGHDIRWAVVLDGTVRISIGCQSAAGAERDIAAACEQAVRSAHEIR